MKFGSLSKTSPTHLSFTLTHTDFSECSVLRRIMMSEVPTFAMEEITVITNTSIFPDEFIAHRLGLIPVSVNAPQELELNVTVLPSDPVRVITTSCFTPSTIFPQEIPILKLKGGQSIHLKAQIEEGLGLTHSKWSPVCKCIYRSLNEDQTAFQFEIETVWDDPQKIVKQTLEIFREKLGKIIASPHNGEGRQETDRSQESS